MIDNSVSKLDGWLRGQLSMTGAGLGKIMQAGHDQMAWRLTLDSALRGVGAVERLGPARCPAVTDPRSRSNKFAVAGAARRGVRGRIVGHTAAASL
jgi:hypothetical protein